MKKNQYSRGITLITLVVTIVVLIILATISINAIMGEDGIIKKAQEGKELSEQKALKELVEIAVANSRLNENGSIKLKELEKGLNNINISSEEIIKQSDGNLSWEIHHKGYKVIINEDGSVELTVSSQEESVIIEDIYVKLYTDKTLTFSSKDETVVGKTLLRDYGNIKGKIYTNVIHTPWYGNRENIEKAEAIDRINPSNLDYWFANCTKLKEVDFTNIRCLLGASASRLFYKCNEQTNIDIEFNTTNVTNMQNMFEGCSKLTSLNLSSFDTGNVTNMSNMFYGCISLTNLNLSGFDTGNVTNMQCMFGTCSSLTSLDLSSFDTFNVTNMHTMFQGCSSLTSLNLINFDTNNVTNMQSMFRLCTKLTNISVDKTKWKVIANSANMFLNCGTSSVTYI